MSAPEIPFLQGLDANAAAAIRRRMVSLVVPGGRALFEQGEEGDALYTIVTGSVGISAADARTGNVRRIARLRPPDTFGELALLSPGPRSATATALRDTHLLRLARRDFEDIVERHPKTLLYFTQLLAGRLRTADEGRFFTYAPRTFAVLAVTRGPSPTAFAHGLARAFDDVLPGATGCVTEWPDGADPGWLHRFETAHARTILVGEVMDRPQSRLILHQADHVLLLAEPGEPMLQGVAAALSDIPSPWIRRDLVVRQSAGTPLPRPVHPAFDELPVSMRIHIREDDSSDYRRLARLTTRSARGLVLGGGGARGLAHVGVLQALDEAGYTVDFVGGTSMGAVVAASFATGSGLDRVRDWTTRDFAGRNPVNDYTLPYVALTRGAKVDAWLEAHFGDTRIQDLWLPFFCVSSNLTTGEIMVHRSGRLTDALRASVAIPGLLPPVCADEGVLVDGGMMNNLPADVMADMERGTVLAVDVGSDLAFHRVPRRGWRGRLMRQWLSVPEAMPALAPLLLRAATVSGSAQTLMALDHATAVLKPPLAGIDLRDWSSYEEAAELGYRHTREAIENGRLHVWCGPSGGTPIEHPLASEVPVL
ncbi:patatin-like phospholipase family protein [Methylobacterium sp. yr668]|uniref:patatin-like phospholipase family protein n=1 Tax=Methylobacterium sp. yr668 TaxID=1761801 RepID=UPI0008EF82A5|nr:patatin-like phospholipase family protein [Methylobacterium sp. yr668]SFT27537.1 NTE family protein [Methylobacterium sp. yr668]